MALPRQDNSQIFELDQRVNFRVLYWDTASTALRLGSAFEPAVRETAAGSGVGFVAYDLLAPTFRPTTVAAIVAACADPLVTRPVLGRQVDGVARSGVVPNVYTYWGAGVVDGGTRAQQTVLHYFGTVRDVDAGQPVSFAIGGQGTVALVRTRAADGVQETLLAPSAIREPNPRAKLAPCTPDLVREQYGYQIVQNVTFAAGDRLDLYYVQAGEPWGGIVAKVKPGTFTTTAATAESFLAEVREAAVLGTSFLAAEANPRSAIQLPYVLRAEVQRAANTVPELRLVVALNRAGDATGYALNPFQNTNTLRDHVDPSIEIKRGRAVHLQAGYRRGDGTDELYPRFTGYVEDIQPHTDGTATVIARGFEGLLADTIDENAPDRLSYLANGYVLREGTTDPVFGIPAADHWPLETYVADLFARAGVDAVTLGRHPTRTDARHGQAEYRTTRQGLTVRGAARFRARLLAAPAESVRLERNPNYGNVAPVARDYLPPDDPYLFRPEVTQRFWDRAVEVATKYGYDVGCTVEGYAFLAARNNPVGFHVATGPSDYAPTWPSATPSVRVNAVAGVVFETTESDPAWSRVLEFTGTRCDLYVGVGRAADGRNGGRLQVQLDVLDVDGTWSAFRTLMVSTWADADEAYFYDGAIRADDRTNAAVAPIRGLPFDRYRVTITPAGPETAQGESTCRYRLNGIALYERDAEASAFVDAAGTPVAFSTLAQVLSLTPESNAKDLRNKAIVVGGRKAVVTDSAKLGMPTVAGGQAVDANNPDREFHVAVAVDPFSLYDPTSPSYIGHKRTAIVYDEKVADTDFARWYARTILDRARSPRTSAPLTHTAVPTIEIRDAVYAVEERHGAVAHLLWTTGLVERWDSAGTATVDLDLSPWAEFPSYQPREDVDIDTLLVDPADGKGEPAIDVRISYRNVYGRPVTNAHLTDVAAVTEFRSRTTEHVPSASASALVGSVTLPTPVVPETCYLAMGITHTDTSALRVVEADGLRYPRRVLANGPYRQFWTTSYSPTDGRPTLTWDFQEGDGTAGVYDEAYYGFPGGGATAWRVLYDPLPDRGAENPWYDPYTSELGNLVEISATLLVSGRVRASLWAASAATGLDIPVAWLTQPTADPEEPEAHWAYQEAGPLQWTYDGVDTIGIWNQLQSADLAAELQGAFGDRPTAVGRGYYAWNDAATARHTLIGDVTVWNGRAPNLDAAGAPYYTIGQHTRLYVRLEVANDRLLRRDAAASATGAALPRVVDSRALPTALGMNDVPATYLWQHLPEPTQVGIRIQDWVHVDGAGVLTQAWVPGTPTDVADWSGYSAPGAEATVRVGKPVRITFAPSPRRGPMYEREDRTLDADRITGKLTREIHLKRTVLDQFWTVGGGTWSDFHKDWAAAAAGIERKRLTNRMYHGDDHTLAIEDAAWRTGADLQTVEWIVDPTAFELDFGSGQVERLRYADFQQTEALPGFDARRTGGTGATGTRAHLLLAYLADLFYFSAFCLDRSGRRTWCLNAWTDEAGQARGFVDRSKIATAERRAASADPGSASYAPAHLVRPAAKSAERYLTRSIFCRQWVEPGWADGTYPGNPVTQYTITDAHQRNYVQLPMRRLDPYNAPGEVHPLAGVGGATDEWLVEYSTQQSGVAQLLRRMEQGFPSAVTNPIVVDRRWCPTSFGTWTFDRPGLVGVFRPNPGRDFHPYLRYPVSPDMATRRSDWYLDAGPSAEVAGGSGVTLGVLESTGSNYHFRVRDHSAQEQWYGHAYFDTYAAQYAAANPGLANNLRRWFYGARTESTVEEFGARGPRDLHEGQSLPRVRAEALFDYSRLDALDRWEQFRGVIARGPYADRTYGAGEGPYHDEKRSAAGNAQPVRAAGTYLFTTVRYDDFWLAPVHGFVPNARCHWTSKATDWFDARYLHEYVWYGAAWFPTAQNGSAQYAYVGTEWTGAARFVGHPWASNAAHLRVDPTALTFDGGAWCGWRPDGGTTAHLRWWQMEKAGERMPMRVIGGGHTFTVATGEATESIPSFRAITGTGTAIRRNILDEYGTRAPGPRLAVGPDLPEARGLVLNLALPERLRGD